MFRGDVRGFAPISREVVELDLGVGIEMPTEPDPLPVAHPDGLRPVPEPVVLPIESLVRELSHKRLTDGQFDQSDLTFRELGQIEDTIIKTVCAIYHSRISYPSTREVDEETQPSAETPTGTG